MLGTLGVRKGGIFLFDNMNKKISLRCAWKLAVKTLDIKLTSDELIALDADSDELAYRIDEFKHLPKLFEYFKNDNLGSLSVLKVRGKLIGLIVIGNKLKETPLSEKELSFFKTLSRNISVAINNFLLLSELREANVRLDEKIQEVSILYQASQMISSELQLQALLDMAMNAIAEITEIERGSTWLLNEENGTFNLMSHLGDASMLTHNLTSDDSKVIIKVEETKEPVEYEEGRNETLELSEKDKSIFGTSFVVRASSWEWYIFVLLKIWNVSQPEIFV